MLLLMRQTRNAVAAVLQVPFLIQVAQIRTDQQHLRCTAAVSAHSGSCWLYLD